MSIMNCLWKQEKVVNLFCSILVYSYPKAALVIQICTCRNMSRNMSVISVEYHNASSNDCDIKYSVLLVGCVRKYECIYMLEVLGARLL